MDQDRGDWTLLINSVRTPLGFFTFVALLLDGVMLGTSAFTEGLPLAAPLALLLFLVACVFAIVWRKPYALYHPSDWRVMTVNLIFPVEPIQVDLAVDRCRMEVRDKSGKVKPSGKPNLTFGHGGWSFRLGEDTEPSDSVRLELVEHSGRNWRVNPFAPYEREARALQVSDGEGS